FGGNAHLNMSAATACNGFATHWLQSGVAAGSWIKIYPNNAPFSANLVKAHTYTASMTLSGSGAAHINMWDGYGAADATGIGDNPGPSITLGATPRRTSVTFTMGGTTPPELQLRVDGTGSVNVDMTISDVTIR